jgi:hypothetical protein
MVHEAPRKNPGFESFKQAYIDTYIALPPLFSEHLDT